MREAMLLPRGSLLVAGLPATGKSSFGTWLEEQRGYVHLDFDEEELMQRRGFGNEQQLLWQHQQGEPLRQALIARHQPIVLSWGFAPHFLPTVVDMISWGFTPVWFTAAPATARQAFLQRGGIDVRFFDQHLAQITPLEQEIMAVFENHVLTPLLDDGTRLPFSTLYPQLIQWLA